MKLTLLALALALTTTLTFAASAHSVPKNKAAVQEFRSKTVCPATGKPELSCAGYIVTHKVSPKCKGKDELANLTYTLAASTPEKGCKHVNK